MKSGVFLVFLCICQINASFYEAYYKQAMGIVKSMNLDQKIGQTIQVDANALVIDNITSNQNAIKYSLGSIYLADNCPGKDGNLLDYGSMSQDKRKVSYAEATVQNYKKMTQKLTFDIDIKTENGKSYRIKPFFANDPVHGDQRVAGNILFPHNIGLSCSHNSQNFYNMGYWTRKSMKRYGFNFAHAPTVAVSHNPQWGRYFQTMGQQHQFIFEYAKAFTQGLQGKVGQNSGVLGSVKHFFSDGATFYGANEGSAKVGSFKSFIHHNVQGFNASILSGIGSVMPSYSGINFVPLHGGSHIYSILKNDLSFDGFVISDQMQHNKFAYQGLPTSLQHMRTNQSIATMISSGVDMFLYWGGNDQIPKYINSIKMLLQNDTISMERLDDAVANILSVKLAFGVVKLVEQDKNKEDSSKQMPKVMHKTEEYQDSLEAVHESLVLLKNKDIIPVQVNNLEYVVLVGQKIINVDREHVQLFLNYDNIGMQCGGWSSRWQGFNGNPIWIGQNKKSSNASSILDALNHSNQKFKPIYPNYTNLTDINKISQLRSQYLGDLEDLARKMTYKNTLILAVQGQTPYAQATGDVNIPFCQNKSLYNGTGCLWWPSAYSQQIQPNTLNVSFDEFDTKVINQIKKNDKNIPMVTVLLSGRPMIINGILNESSAFISAFLPGTSGGQGIVDAIFGDYVFRPKGQKDRANSLSFDWPKSMQQLKDFPYYAADGQVPRISEPLFKVGYGLSSAPNSE